MARELRLAGLFGLASLLLWLLLAFCSQPPFIPGYQEGHDRVILDASGNPLARINHPAQKAGQWLDEIPPLVQAAAIAAEDKRFYQHWGIDLRALGRALWQNISQGRVVSGASTITMQVARLENPAPRTYYHKAREAARACWLEANYSKQEILAWYVNLAPFGGPLVGLSAASEHLMHKDPWRLSAVEAATLLSLPQDPSNLLLPQNYARLQKRRNLILSNMAQMGAISSQELEEGLSQPVYIHSPPPLPLVAPHFANMLKQNLPEGAPAQIKSYLVPAWQNRIDYLVKSLCERMSDKGLRQAAVVVIRNRDRAIMAWVGSSDFYNPQAGQVDGVTSLRQPGSALKPFVYALALEQGAFLSQPLADTPLVLAGAEGTYRPRDYDGHFRGQVNLRTALGSSLNLPALRLAYKLSPDSVLDSLRSLGFSLPLSAEHYGPGLALGNGEVTLLALSNAFATLASEGRWLPPRLWQGQETVKARPALDARASALITSVLADDGARALGFGVGGVLKLPFPAAVKTGTSQHHRDNWCVGYSKDYTVGVWAGNFESQMMRDVSGVSGAAPLWRQVMLLIHQDMNPTLPPDPPGISRARVCLASGLNAGPSCPLVGEELIARPLPDCNLHNTAAVPAPRPPGGLNLINPAPNGIYALDPDIPRELQALNCQLNGLQPNEEVTWKLNDKILAQGEISRLRLPLTPGRHTLKVESAHRSVVASYTVLGN